MSEYELAKAAEQAAALASKNANKVNAAATAVVANPKNAGAVAKLADATGQAAADANKTAEGFREHLAPTYRVPKLDGFTSTTIPAGVIEGMCPSTEYRSRIMPEGYMNEADNLGISTPFYDGCQ
jgi:hypothetical protein